MCIKREVLSTPETAAMRFGQVADATVSAVAEKTPIAFDSCDDANARRHLENYGSKIVSIEMRIS